MKLKNFLILCLATVASLFVAVPLAQGALHSLGQSAGSAVSASYLPVTVSALVGGDSPSTLLQPGSSADVILRIHNFNTKAVDIVSVVGNGAITVTGASGTCTTSGVTFTDQTGLSISVAGSTTVLIHLANAASMSTASQSGCQGATFLIPISATAHLI